MLTGDAEIVQNPLKATAVVQVSPDLVDALGIHHTGNTLQVCDFKTNLRQILNILLSVMTYQSYLAACVEIGLQDTENGGWKLCLGRKGALAGS